jgi:hypothetical protein
MSNLKKVDGQSRKKKPDERHVDLLVKEFDMDRFRATNILKSNDCDLK